MKNIDSDKNNRYNKTKGGVNNEESSDSKLLEKGRVSTISGNRNSLRKQSSNTEKISKLLGVSAKNIKAGESTGSRVFDENIERFYSETGQVRRRLWESAIGNLSRIDLQTVDTVGRKIPKTVLQEFNDTVFKTSDGKILSLYHWTNAKFNIKKKSPHAVKQSKTTRSGETSTNSISNSSKNVKKMENFKEWLMKLLNTT